MKTTRILFIAAVAVAMALASCTKEQTGTTTDSNQKSSLRTLTVSFAPGTRTSLDSDGLQPLWEKDDVISLSNGTTTKTHTVTADEAGKASFEITTDLDGTITAIYPAGATSDGQTIKVSANEQNGKFADANICKATAAEGVNDLTFYNQTAIIKVMVPTGTKKLTLTSMNPISSSTGQRAETGAISIADDDATTITIGDGSSPIENPCYISVLPGTLLRDLNVDVVYGESKTAQGGFAPNAIIKLNEQPSEYAVTANFLYTLVESSLHEYIKVNVGTDQEPKYQKWATMNIGASSPTEGGLYFMWADTQGYEYKNSTFYKAGTDTEIPSGGFVDSNAPYYSGSAYTKYTGFDNKLVLDLEDDAAYMNWGGAWHMPNIQDANAFSAKPSIDNKCYVVRGIIFPWVWPAFDMTFLLPEDEDTCNYWLSSLSVEDCLLAQSIEIYHTFRCYFELCAMGRRYGMPVRPFSE